jgi:hypothetical protein
VNRISHYSYPRYVFFLFSNFNSNLKLRFLGIAYTTDVCCQCVLEYLNMPILSVKKTWSHSQILPKLPPVKWRNQKVHRLLRVFLNVKIIKSLLKGYVIGRYPSTATGTELCNQDAGLDGEGPAVICTPDGDTGKRERSRPAAISFWNWFCARGLGIPATKWRAPAIVHAIVLLLGFGLDSIGTRWGEWNSAQAAAAPEPTVGKENDRVGILAYLCPVHTES